MRGVIQIGMPARSRVAAVAKRATMPVKSSSTLALTSVRWLLGSTAIGWPRSRAWQPPSGWRWNTTRNRLLGAERVARNVRGDALRLAVGVQQLRADQHVVEIDARRFARCRCGVGEAATSSTTRPAACRCRKPHPDRNSRPTWRGLARRACAVRRRAATVRSVAVRVRRGCRSHARPVGSSRRSAATRARAPRRRRCRRRRSPSDRPDARGALRRRRAASRSGRSRACAMRRTHQRHRGAALTTCSRSASSAILSVLRTSSSATITSGAKAERGVSAIKRAGFRRIRQLVRAARGQRGKRRNRAQRRRHVDAAEVDRVADGRPCLR